MELTKYLLTLVGAYLLGSISVSVLMSKLLGADVRTKGSGNAGATNMARVFGIAAGLLTLLGDMLKTAAAFSIGWLLLGEKGLAAAGMACITGHCFPIFHRFRGGKGVSSGAVIAFVIDWRVGLAAVIAFALAAVLSKKVSLGSVCAAIAILASSFIFAVSTPRLILAIYSMCLAVFQHRANIKRLIKGEEPDFKLGKTRE